MDRFFEEGAKLGGFMCFLAFMAACLFVPGFFLACLAIDWWYAIKRWWNRKPPHPQGGNDECG